MKKRSCLFCFFSLLFTFIELKTTKTSSAVKNCLFFQVFCGNQVIWNSRGNHDPGHDGIDHIKICNIGISSALKVNWLPFKLLTSNFQSKRSSLARGPPGQENPRYEPGMEMLTHGFVLNKPNELPRDRHGELCAVLRAPLGSVTWEGFASWIR